MIDKSIYAISGGVGVAECETQGYRGKRGNSRRGLPVKGMWPLFRSVFLSQTRVHGTFQRYLKKKKVDKYLILIFITYKTYYFYRVSTY